jgi:hemolysin III
MPSTTYAAREELLHALTHGFGALLSVVALVAMVVWAAPHSALQVVACAVFGGALVAMYAASTLYHAVPATRVRTKRALQVADHCCIYLLIAGTYTPFTLVTLNGPWGWSIFGVVWGLAVVGIVLKLAPLGHRPWLSNLGYLAIGWVALVALEPLVAALPVEGLVLLVAGGLTYSLGVAFYAWDRLPYNHAVWHLFVLGGSTLHYLTVQWYVIG